MDQATAESLLTGTHRRAGPGLGTASGRRSRCHYGWIVGLLLCSCGGNAGPDEIARRYVDALAKGDAERAFETLSSGTRARLAAAEDAWRSGNAGDPLVPPETWPDAERRRPPGLEIFRRLSLGSTRSALPLPVDAAARIGTAIVDGERARVGVAAPSGTRELSLVRENDGWRLVLDLPPP